MIIRKYEIPGKGNLIIKFNDDKKTVKYIETHTKENEKPVIIESYEKMEYREDDNERISKKDKVIKYTHTATEMLYYLYQNQYFRFLNFVIVVVPKYSFLMILNDFEWICSIYSLKKSSGFEENGSFFTF